MAFLNSNTLMTHKFMSLFKSNQNASLNSIQNCLSTLCSWYTQNGLSINPTKSESILFSTSKRLQDLQSTGLTNVIVSNATVPLTNTIKTLGITLDSSLPMSNQLKSIAKSCNFHLRAIKHIRHLLTEQDASSLTVALVHSKLDYCNSILYNT